MRFSSLPSLLLAPMLVLFIGVFNMTGAQQSTTSKEDEHEKWLEERLKEAKSIKPGMSCSALLKVFREEGGLQSCPPTHYRLKSCGIIRIDVTFLHATDEGARYAQTDLSIAGISAPYLDDNEAMD